MPEWHLGLIRPLSSIDSERRRLVPPCYVSLLPSMGISPPVVHTPIAQ
jgi:hypothetical protein